MFVELDPLKRRRAQQHHQTNKHYSYTLTLSHSSTNWASIMAQDLRSQEIKNPIDLAEVSCTLSM
jgi:hypothetical protein